MNLLEIKEKELLSLQIRKDRSKLEEILDSDFREIIPSGEFWNRDQIVNALIKDDSGLEYDAFNFQTVFLIDNLAQVTYITKNPKNDEKVFRSSLWVCKKNKWRMVFHQGTVINKEKNNE